jgi:hypothetical protein
MALARAQAKPAALIPSGCPGGRCTSKHYDEDQPAALAALIAGINAWNRLNVMPAAVTRAGAGSRRRTGGGITGR